MAVANYRNDQTRNVNSKIYKWNGTSFVEFQNIPTHGGHDWKRIEINGEIYLAVANNNNDSTQNIDSKIYKWNGASFTEFQSVPTKGAAGLQCFEINGETYLAVANNHNDSTYNTISKIYKWNGTSFVEFQSVPTNGALYWASFLIDNETYLAVANNYNGTTYNINSKIYKWDPISFTEYQAIPTNGALDWESLKIDGDSFLAVANQYNGSTYNVDSKIYKWNGISFVLFQTIPTNAGRASESFQIDGETYLAVANYYNGSTRNIDSKIYKWDGVSFVEFQSIATNGALDWESFVIDGETYLAAANHYNGSTYNINSKIYRWNGTSFVEFQAIPTNGAYAWESLAIDGEPYLAVANYRNSSNPNINSKIYKWNGTSFVEFQSIPTNGAMGWESVEINGEIYLAVANHYNNSTYSINSKIYKWNGASFAEFQSVPTNGARDWQHFEMNGETYLALANFYNDTTYHINSKIYKWNGTAFAEFQSIATSGAHDSESFQIAGKTYLAVANSRNDTTYNINSKIYALSSKSVSDGLLAYYPFDNSADDKSGNGYDGIPTGVIYGADRYGDADTACSFDGVDDYVKIPAGPSLIGSSELTLAAWIKSDSTQGTGWSRIIEIGADSNNSTALVLGSDEVDPKGTVQAWIHADGARKGVTTTEGERDNKNSLVNYNDDTWHFLAFTYDGSVTMLYVDGKLKDTSFTSGRIDSPPTTLFGQHKFSIPDNLSSFGGLIDDARIYGRALTQYEILSLFNEGNHWTDMDDDGVLDDGDASGNFGDNPCSGGNTQNCDDNCPYTQNSDQQDTDGDGIGEVCDQVIYDTIISQSITIGPSDTTYDNDSITIDRCTLTIDGTHNFENISLINGAVLTHSSGQNGVNLDISGDLTIDPISSINIDGKGYGRASGPGRGISGGTYKGGGGGGYGGYGATGASSGGQPYGRLTQPVECGSGGGNGYSGVGGAGGGAIRLDIGGAFLLNGKISANGNDGEGCNYHGGGGAGGSIYIITAILRGEGSIAANGGKGNSTASGCEYAGGGGGSGGRVAIYYGDATDFDFNRIIAQGNDKYKPGGAGTIFTKSSSQTYGILRIDNGGNLGAATPLLDGFSPYTFDDVEIGKGGTLEIPPNSILNWVSDNLSIYDGGQMAIYGEVNPFGSTEFVNITLDSGAGLTLGGDVHIAAANGVTISSNSNLVLEDSSQLSCPQINILSGSSATLKGLSGLDCQIVQLNGTLALTNATTFPGMHIGSGGILTSTGSRVDLTIEGDLMIDSGGSISVDGKGYGPRSGPGRGGSISNATHAYFGGGAGHGGRGGRTDDAPGGSPYGSVTEPTGLGSGGGNNGGNGGGAIRLVVNGTLSVDGNITANGTNGSGFKAVNWGVDKGGGGSGGSIYVTAGNIDGIGTLQANGGKGGEYNAWGGSDPDPAAGGAGGRIAIYCDSNTFAGSLTTSGGAGEEPGGQGTIYTDGRLVIVPNKGGNIGSVSTHIYCSANDSFEEGATVSLVKGSDTITANPIVVSYNGQAISATFDLVGRDLGAWDLVVTDPGKEPYLLAEAFTIEPGRSNELWVDILGLNNIRVGREQQYQIVFGNKGNVDEEYVSVYVGIPRGLNVRFVLDPAEGPFSFDPENIPPDYLNDQIVFELVLDKMPANDQKYIVLLLETETSNGQTLNASIGPGSVFELALDPSFMASTSSQNFTCPDSCEKSPTPNQTLKMEIWLYNAVGKDHRFNPPQPRSVVHPFFVTQNKLYNQEGRGNNRIIKSIPRSSNLATDRATLKAKMDESYSKIWQDPNLDSHWVDAWIEVQQAQYDAFFCIMDKEETTGGGVSWNCMVHPDLMAQCAGIRGGQGFIDDMSGNPCWHKGDNFRSSMEVYNFVQNVNADPCSLKNGCSIKNHCNMGQMLYIKDMEYLEGDVSKTITPVYSLDPNEKVGAEGIGESAYLSPMEPFRYLVSFENLETATTPAQEVVITDQLDLTTMDLGTFSLGPISFGDRVLTPPQGVSAFTTEVDLRPGNDLIVLVEAFLDNSTGLLTWRFLAKDPVTGGWPEDPLAGFLPPNINPPEGDGSVLFTVMPKEGLPTGTQIRNKASIIFDTNAPIETPEWLNTIDNSKPTSQVSPLPSVTDFVDFEVQWAGSDQGAGIKDYTVFVSQDGGAFQEWLTNTPDTSATFAGENRKTYAFYSVSRDQVGNVEDPPLDPDTAITVVRVDDDGDGYTVEDGDCNDTDSSVYPGATEICDNVDNDCDEAVDDGFDADGDRIADCTDNCPATPNPGQEDTDQDTVGDDCDGCPNDTNKTQPGLCGCGVADTDSDNDGTLDCNDSCPNDPNKTVPSICGCGVADTDSDSDGTPDCDDNCPNDPNKTEPGVCGCGAPDTDTDADGTPDCNDGCPSDPDKVAPGACGCGSADTDTDGDIIVNCVDNCPTVANPDQADSNNNGIGDACEIQQAQVFIEEVVIARANGTPVDDYAEFGKYEPVRMILRYTITDDVDDLYRCKTIAKIIAFGHTESEVKSPRPAPGTYELQTAWLPKGTGAKKIRFILKLNKGGQTLVNEVVERWVTVLPQ